MEETTTTEPLLPADPGIKQEHNDYPAEDRDNPFLLVKNRKCGRMVTKHF
ncbi:BnaC06g05150D [Brassica napus]|uniref:BnaC06g05150D protein n=1 Tax=Brassica napus TaxID=3708 RepID=A0A078IF57_BRANA|nr:BnaC06g05150D [Brassica napus]